MGATISAQLLKRAYTYKYIVRIPIRKLSELNKGLFLRTCANQTRDINDNLMRLTILSSAALLAGSQEYKEGGTHTRIAEIVSLSSMYLLHAITL